MDGVGAGTHGRVDDRVDAQVALARRAWSDGVRLVGIPDVHRQAVALGEDGNRLDIHFTARADDTHRDLAAIGDEDFLHGTLHCSPANA
jgi:hypothetical protein